MASHAHPALYSTVSAQASSEPVKPLPATAPGDATMRRLALLSTSSPFNPIATLGGVAYGRANGIHLLFCNWRLFQGRISCVLKAPHSPPNDTDTLTVRGVTVWSTHVAASV